jgi:hypothetical protein
VRCHWWMGTASSTLRLMPLLGLQHVGVLVYA